MKNIIVGLHIVTFLCLTKLVYGSAGDRSQYFINCVQGCKYNNCTEDGLYFTGLTTKQQPQEYFSQLLLWSCEDECKYNCMWRTTNAFMKRNWEVPQFYGKWPFRRAFGMQEPASVLFSLLNFWMHLKMIKQFRKEIRSDSPMYYVWHAFCGVCLNAWIWSIVFHTRDYPITELFDYSFAYSMVLATCMCSVLRMLHKRSRIIKAIVTLSGIYYFLNYFAHLNGGHLDYGYNMKRNIVTGLIPGFGWIFWYIFNRKTKPYAWKIVTFQLLAAVALLLEVNDFPPILWIFDAHSLWHLATVPLTKLFYSFIIDDCKNLRQEKQEKEKLI